VRAREVNRRIERAGGQQVAQRGSHRKYRVVAGTVSARTTVPQHAGDIPSGTLRAIERDLEPALGKGWLLAMTYTIRVAREAATWLAEVDDLPGAHTYARSLRALDGRVREVVALVEDLPAGAEDALLLEWDYSDVVPDAGAPGHEALDDHPALTTRTQDLVARLVAQGWTKQDIATVLRMTPRRVSRLAGRTPHAA
jgi:predicted RNA binding protein YcfA (HicA-like mRNA interferase family)/predicted RNase H-like HicB family nuclease